MEEQTEHLFQEMEQHLEEYRKTQQQLQQTINEKKQELKYLSRKIQKREDHLKKILSEKLSLKEEQISPFVDQPYALLPKEKNKYWVVVPKFIPFHIGWLERQTKSYNIFTIDKYVQWITDIPEEIQERIGMESPLTDARVEHREDVTDLLHVPPSETDKAYNLYKDKLYARAEQGTIKVSKGKEFDLIADLLDDGLLPFSKQPIKETDLREEPAKVSLRPFQKRAWEKFKETGAIGVYWAPKSGKTFFSLYAGERIQGDKLVIVPTSTLEEQWENRINKFCSYHHEWEVRTYHYVSQYHLEEYQKKDLALTIFDEVHHLPANTFSRLASINTKYRIGLSASPYREDNRTNYIFALTGFPMGLKWQEQVDLGIVEEPDIYIYLYRTQHQKKQDMKRLVDLPGKTLIFCDSISKGKTLARKYNLPFVYGETTKRMEKFENNRVIIGSRVADEGISISDIDRVIEYDFLGGSRRQEVQRMGRVMHGEGSGEHIVMMTDKEYRKFEKRLYAIEEHGFNIEIQRIK